MRLLDWFEAITDGLLIGMSGDLLFLFFKGA